MKMMKERKTMVNLNHISVRQVFRHIEPNGIERAFMVDDMRDAILRRRLPAREAIVALDQDGYDLMMRDRGVEEWKIARLMHPYLSQPGILCHFNDDDSDLLVDGTHRYVRLWRDGVREMAMYLVAEKFWKPFALEVA